MSELRSVAALYDIHGNAVALAAVLAELELQPPDAVVVGGDVSAGPQPLECLALLRALPVPVHFIRGNADRVVVMAYDGSAPDHVSAHPLFEADTWTAARLPRAERDFLAALPGLVRLTVAGLGEVLFCHATARSDEERVTVFTPEERLARVLDQAGAPLVVAGHTHRQFDRSAGGRRLVNAGSAAAIAQFRTLGYPAAAVAAGSLDADAVARRYEELAAKPVAQESLIAPAEVW